MRKTDGIHCTTSQDLHRHALHGMQVNDDHITSITQHSKRCSQSQLLQTSLAPGFAPQRLQGKALAKINLLFSHACQRYRLVQLVYGCGRVCVKLQCRGPADHCVMASAHYFHFCCAGGFLWPMLISFLRQSRFHCQGTESHADPRNSSISGYLFFFSRMASVSRATDLEKAPVLS